MSTPEDGPELFKLSQVGEALLAQLGGTATREVTTLPSDTVANALSDISTPNGAVSELHTSIAELGDRKLSLLDIALNVDMEVNKYLETMEGYVPRAIAYGQVPDFLSALIPPQSTKVRKQLSRVWDEYISAQYGLSDKAPDPKPLVPFRKGKPHTPPAGRTDPPQRRPKRKSFAKQQKAARRKSSSASLEASRKFDALQRNSE